MKAVGLTSFGGPEVLHLVEVPDDEAGPGEVRVRVHAATVNPTDTALRNGFRAAQLKDVPPPYVPGMDVAGVLEQVGEGAGGDLQVGDHVMGIVMPRGAHGGYRERIVLPAASVARSPAGTSDVEAATLPMNGLTARLALDELGLSPGQTLAVTGAAGAVGGYAIQLAKAEGLRVVADAAERDEPLVRDLGADVVVERGPRFAEAVRELLAGGADGLVDTALLNELAVPAVRDGGGIATLRGWAGNGERGITFYPVMVRSYAQEHEKLERLRRQVEAGQITLRVARTFPAAEAAEAHRVLEAGGTRGRLVLEL